MRRLFTILAAALALSAATATSATAETPVGKSVESRVLAAFAVDADAVAPMMPEGWRLLTLPKGPLAGSNVLLSLIDRHLRLDPDGAPAVPGTGRSASLLAFGVKPGVDGARLFVLRVYETTPVASDYGNGVEADISRTYALSDGEGGSRQHQESWRIATSDRGSLDVLLEYDLGTPSWQKDAAQPYSAVDPEFHRIYRYERLVELAMSEGMGKPLAGSFEIRNDIPELKDIFDSRESLKGLLVIPVYVREVSLP